MFIGSYFWVIYIVNLYLCLFFGNTTLSLITVFYNIFVFLELLTVVISVRKKEFYFWLYTKKTHKNRKTKTCSLIFLNQTMNKTS